MTDKNVVVTVYALRVFITIIVIEFSIQLDLLYTFKSYCKWYKKMAILPFINFQ